MSSFARTLRRVFCAFVLMAAMENVALADDLKALVVAEPQHGTGYLPLYMAIHKGFFAEQGLEIKVLTVESGSGHTNAVLAGQAFAFIGGPEHDAFAKLKGGELRAVVNVVDRGNVYVIAAKGKEPAAGQSFGDYIRGKSFVTGPFSGTPNSIGRYLLKKYNLDWQKDVRLIEVPTSAVIATIRSGGASVAVSNEPSITQGLREGIWGEPFINIPKEFGPYAYSCINVREDTIQKDPETVRKFVVAMTKGLRFTYDHPDEAAALARKEFPTMALEDLKATLDRSFKDEVWSKDGMITPQSWATAQSVVMAAGVLKQEVAYDQIIDMQFVRPLLTSN